MRPDKLHPRYSPTGSPNHDIFVENGEMGALMRTFDWATTPLGPTETWSQSLKTPVRIILTSRFAMWMCWGPQLTFFYNDAYRPTLGVKHPQALGAPTQEVWAEIWTDIAPRIEHVLQTGEATYDEALMLFLERSGYQEETYHTFSYSPLSNDNGEIAGMLCVVTEDTERVIGERRLTLLREVAAALASVQKRDEVFTAIARCIEADPRDLPFTLTYLFDSDGNAAHLALATTISPEHPVAAPIIGLADADTPWPLQQILAEGEPIIMELAGEVFQTLPSGPWYKAPEKAIVMPIAQQGQERPAGFLVAALNPYRLFDTSYQGFVSLLAGQIASSLANVRAYEEERRRAEALAELDRAKTTFFSNVSHEFRTPLTLMLGPLEDELLEASEPKSRERLEVAHRNSLRLLKLVNSLLDFARIEAGRIQAVYEPVDLSAFTAELASVFRSAVEKAGLRLIIHCPPLSAPVYIDRDMWEKIVLNLLSNAFKFTFQGEIEVSLQEREGRVECTVRDTGTGIPAEELPHLFERFHRVEGSRGRTHEGTGIGLALVQELTRLHSGEVHVTSVLNEGTTFTITLPMGKDHLPSERVVEARPLPSTASRADVFVNEALRWLPEDNRPVEITPLTADELAVSFIETIPRMDGRTEKQRILLADDNADMRGYVRRLLSESYEVTTVADGAQALSAVRAAFPDLILTDVMMPNLDGFGLLKALRSDPVTRTIPIILLSARAGEEARIEGLEAGADDYLTKPFGARELLATIKSHLEMARLRREAQTREEGLRKIAEQARDQLSTILESLNDGFVAFDLQHRYTYVNRRAEQIMGRSREELVGEYIWEIIPEAVTTPFYAAHEQAFRERIPFRLEEFYAPHNTWYEGSFYPTEEGYACYFRDVGERKRADEALRLQKADIEALNERLRRSMTETHHRVKNNLQLISSLIELQTFDHANELVIHELQRLNSHVHTMAAVHDILTQEAKRGNNASFVSAKAVLERMIPMLQGMAGRRNLKASIEEVPLSAKHSTSLALITNELVLNALKHGKDAVEIRFARQEGYAVLEVADDGPGFPDGFDPATSANTGLHLVESVGRWDLNGDVRYENNRDGRGTGAKVILSIPLAEVDSVSMQDGSDVGTK